MTIEAYIPSLLNCLEARTHLAPFCLSLSLSLSLSLQIYNFYAFFMDPEVKDRVFVLAELLFFAKCSQTFKI